MKRLVSGIKPTGDLTIGSYIGAIKQFVALQKEYETFIFVADLHAITVPQDKEALRRNIKDIVAVYIACGLDQDRTTIFVQSENMYHTQLAWALECHTYIGELNRMTQFKDKNKKEGNKSISSGLYTYPVLMASDILLYDADIVPVGDDQKQHVELTRNIAERINNKYGRVFKVPLPIIPKEGARIMDLQDPTKKMSKSDDDYRGCILMLDDETTIRKKIMSAVTDSDNKIYFDIKNKPGISNLMMIYGSLSNMTMDEVRMMFKDTNYGDFKRQIADIVVETLKPIREEYETLINSPIIDEILDKGLEKAIPLAREKYEKVQEFIGLGR